MQELLQSIRAEGSLPILGGVQRFRAGGTCGAFQPAFSERFREQSGGIGREGGFFLVARRVPDANEKTRQEKGDAQKSAAGISRHGAGTIGIERLKNVSKHRESPHGGVFHRRKRIVKNGMRRGEPGPFR